MSKKKKKGANAAPYETLTLIAKKKDLSASPGEADFAKKAVDANEK